MKHILLGVTGGIAAYKAAAFARRLQDAGFTVKVVMTEGAQAFITPLTFQALTGEPVHTKLLDPAAEAGMGHIQLAKWADLVVIAPASANCMARLASGMADDLLSTLCLATAAPVLLAPAMNQQMWANAATQQNLARLQTLGYQMIPPESGSQACGDVGAGRLPEPEVLVAHLKAFVAAQQIPAEIKASLTGKNVVITAGPTQEAIDPVRYISNYSSGKMGFALAKACREAGANVTLVAGRVALSTPVNVARVDVRSARDMLAACEKLADDCDIFIATAAVADYRTREAAPQKIKKSQDEMLLDLVKNPDIVASIAKNYPHTFVVGFAAETQNLAEYARGKLQSKNLDMIACNDVSRSDIGFGADENAMTVFFAHPQLAATQLEKASKDTIATQLVVCIHQAFAAK